MKKIISLILIFSFVISFMPLQALAADTQQIENQSQAKKIKDGQNSIAVEKTKKESDLDRSFLEPSNVNQNSISVDDFIYGHSVLYNLLKKLSRVDLLGKSLKEISAELTKGTATDKQGTTQTGGLSKIAAPTEKALQMEKETGTEGTQAYRTDRFIVNYKSGKKEEGQKDITSALSTLGTIKTSKKKDQDVIFTKNSMSVNQLLSEISSKKADGNIKHIQPDYPISVASNDTYFPMQWGVANQEVTGADKKTYKIDANVVPAWKVSQGDSVVAALIDTGVDTTHEDLAANIIDGWNFLDDNNQVFSSSDNETHGTNVAGIIAAQKDNNKGIAGVAPAVKIMPLKVFRNGTAYTSDIIDAIEYAAQHGAKIVNCSWGSSSENQALQEAIADSNLLFICAAGNSGKDIDTNPVYPAAYSGNNIISAASIDRDGQLSSFSNYGTASVDVAAPGEDIVSAAPGNAYVEANGTSMSAAFVSGEAALLLSKYPTLSIQEMRTKIINSSDHLSSLAGKVCEGHKINAANGLNNIFPAFDTIINVLPGSNTGTSSSGEEGDFMKLFTTETETKAWYNTLVGPSTTNSVSEQKYSVWENLQELISPQTGDLTLKQTDIHLSGRNGLDLEIGRLYQSNLALFGERRAAADGSAYNDYSTYLQNRYGLGVGWSFNFPSVQVEEDEGVKELYYHTGSGPVYHVKFTTDTSDSNLEEYYKKDAVFDNDTTYTNQDGVQSQYVFATADHTKRYFAVDGRLLAIKDRFGNEIKFKHTERRASNLAPNNDFTYSEAQGIWTINSNYSYDMTTGKDDTSSLKFNSASAATDSSYSRYIPVLPNTKYALSGFINSQLTSGSLSLTYRQYDQNYTQLSQGTLNTATQNNTWQELSQTFTTAATAKYIRIEYVNTNAIGTSRLDKVRFDRMWPLISEITDTIGRVVNFAYTDTLYDENPANAGTITVTVHAPSPLNDTATYTYTLDQKLVNYKWSNWQEERRFPYLTKSNNGETDTLYKYDDRDERYSYSSKTTSGTYQNSKRPVLTEMDLRNSRVKYEYSLATKHLGENGFYETYRITSRYEQAENDTGYMTGQDYKQTYTYSGLYNSTTYDNETGYPGPYSLASDATYQFTTTMTQTNGLKTEQTYKGKYEYKTVKSHVDTANVEKEISMVETYDTCFLDQPTKKKLETINSNGTQTLYVGHTYNDWGGLASETRPLTQAQWDDAVYKGQQTINYSYEPTYKFLSSKRYYQSVNKVLVESIAYDSSGRITTKTNAKGETTQYQYDTTYPGNITQETINLGNGKTTQTDFDYSGAYYAFPTTVTSHYTENNIPQTSHTHKTYEFIRGNVLTATDARENVTSYMYDNQGRVTDITYPATIGQDGDFVVKDHYTYGNVNLTERSNQAAFNVHLEKTKTLTPVEQNTPVTFFKSNGYYDDHGNLLVSQYCNDLNQNTYVTTDSSYNGYGQVAWVEDARDNRTNYTIDEWNRTTTVTDAQGNQQKVEYDIYNRTKLTYFIPSGGTAENHYKEAYDQWGRVISRKGFPDGINATNVIEEKYNYDIVGNLVKLTDAQNNPTLFQYDALNRLNKVVNALGEKVDYAYDRLGDLTSVKQYEGSKTFTTTKIYDERGLLISKQEPAAANATVYQYNSVGLPVQVTDPTNKVTTMEYDFSNRLKQTNVGQNDYIKNYYSPLGGIEKYRLWAGGTEKDALSYQYALNGQATQRQTGSDTVGFQYDLAGNQTQVTDPIGYATNYTYDSLNRVSTISSGSKNFSYEYYGDGMIKTVTYPTVGGQTLKTEYTYDNINRLKTLVNTKGTTVLSQYAYTYDNNGNITEILEAVEGVSKTNSYEYDALNRLVKMNRSNGENIQYSYDTRGNRIQDAGITVNETEFVPADFGYTVWDELETFKNVTTNETYSYEYDAEGLRTKKTKPNATVIRYHYDLAGRVITESNGSGAVTAQNIWGHKLLARKIGSAYYYYLYNGHGDVVQILNESGNIVNNYSYDEWGNITSKTEGISNPIKYAGEYYDDESGLYYLRARYYDPAIGRFISRDSYEGDISNPLSINSYAYCWGNPIRYIDPTGHYIDESKLGALVDAGYGAVLTYTPGVGDSLLVTDQNGSSTVITDDRPGTYSDPTGWVNDYFGDSVGVSSTPTVSIPATDPGSNGSQISAPTPKKPAANKQTPAYTGIPAAHNLGGGANPAYPSQRQLDIAGKVMAVTGGVLGVASFVALGICATASVPIILGAGSIAATIGGSYITYEKYKAGYISEGQRNNEYMLAAMGAGLGIAGIPAPVRFAATNAFEAITLTAAIVSKTFSAVSIAPSFMP